MLLIVRDIGTKVQDPYLPFNDGLGGSLVRKIVESYFQDDVQYYMVAPDEKSFTKSVSNKYAETFYADLEKLRPTKILAMGVGVDNLLREKTKFNKNTTAARGFLYNYEYSDGSTALCITTINVSNFEKEDKYTKKWQIQTDYFLDFIFDLLKIDKATSVPALPTITRHIVRDIEELDDELAYLSAASVLSLDIETSNKTEGSSPDPREDAIYAVGFGALLSKEVIDVSYSSMIPVELLRDHKEQVVTSLRRFLDNYAGTLVLHNAVFDIRFLSLYLDYDFLDSRVADTMLMASMIDERPTKNRIGGVSLKYLSKLYFNVPDFSFSWKDFYSKEDDEKDWESLYYYLGYDTHCTIALYHVFEDELKDEEGLNWVLDNILYPASVRFAHIVNTGMPVDRDYLKNGIEQYAQEIEDLRASLTEQMARYGVDFDAEDMGSHVKKKKIFTEVFGVDIPNTKEETLEDVAFTHKDNEDLVKFITTSLRLSKVMKLYGTYWEPLYRDSELDGRIHGSFFLNGTATGRLSSANPNLQNMPGTDDYVVRKAFIAPEGWHFATVDYQQLEMRCMTIASEDEVMKQAILDGEDLHRTSASGIFKKAAKAVTKDERSLAKIFNFGMIYGRGGKGIATGKEMRELRRQGKTTMTEKEAWDAIHAYFEKYPGIKEWVDETVAFAERNHFVASVFGRLRRFPLILNENFWKIRNQAMNMPIQSMAGDFTLYSLVKLYDILLHKYGDKVFIINTVHDEIQFLIHDSVLNEALTVIQNVMENPPIDTKGIPIGTDVDLGPNWGEVKEYIYERSNLA